MKLPFSQIIGPMLKPYLKDTGIFCQHPTFSMSLIYTYVYGVLGLVISAYNLEKHLGESPTGQDIFAWKNSEFDFNFMLLHDLRIIASSMGIVQYSCLLVGCFTKNPALFLPHLIGQLVVVAMKIANALVLLVPPIKLKTLIIVMMNIMAIILLSFNWMQEFCVFRHTLCVCDL